MSIHYHAKPVVSRGGACLRPGPYLDRHGATLAHTLLIALALVSIIFLFTPSSVHAASTGHISGQLLDGTKNNVPLAGQSVTLQKAQGGTARDLASSTTDAHGAYSFTNLATDKTINYSVYIRYQGAQYNTNLLDLSTKPEQQVNLTVYEATTNTSRFAIVQATILLHKPDAQKGIVTVSEFFLFRNLDIHTYVGSLDASKGKPNALRFSLPHTARNVTLGAGFNGYKAIQVERGFATDAALLPGVSQFAFALDMPYTQSHYDFDYTVVYPTVQLSMYVPPDIHASSDALASQGVVTADQHPYQLFQNKALLAGKELHVDLEGLPAITPPASSPTVFTIGNILLVVGLLVMLGIVIVTWFFYRSRRDRSSSKRPQLRKTGSKPAKMDTAPDRQQALLQELLDLDKAYTSGKMSKTVYEERRAKTKARLRALMSAKGAS